MANTEDSDLLDHLKTRLLKEQYDNEQVSIFNYFPSIIYVFDVPKKKIRYINERQFSNSLGFTSEDTDRWDDHISQLIFKDDQQAVISELEKFNALKENEQHCYDCRMNHKQGDFRYFRTKGTVLKRSQTGEPESILFLSEDITSKTRSDEELIALKSLIDDTEGMLEFGSWSWEKKTDKLIWTDGMYRLLGYEKKEVEAEISNRFYFNHIARDDQQRVQFIFETAIKNKKDFECNYTLITKHHSQKIISSKGKIVLDDTGEVVKVLGICRDVTGQMQIHRDLLHYKEMILEKEEFLNQGSWEWNINDGTTNWSPGMFRLFGYLTEEETQNIDITKDFLHIHLPDEDSRKKKSEWKLLLKNKNSYTRETNIVTKDGSPKQLETYAKIIHNADGEIEKIIGTTRDVTRLRKYEISLEEKIRELNRSNKELEEFAYVASHDLQEPLRKLTTFSERLQTRFSDRLGNDGMVYLERIGVATENMRVLIENLLEFSRTARSTHLFSFENLTSLLDQVKADLELKIEESGTIIHSGELPSIECIPSQLKQLFDNLLNNSIKFKKKEEPCIINISSSTLSKAEKDALHLPVGRNYFKIVIRDNGIGFEKEYAERIFQIFQRLHGKSEYPGSGIGLAICKKIVENHNGLIHAEGIPDEGATFTVVFPERQTKSENEVTK
jgi:PAS domain S-box-containing protein